MPDNEFGSYLKKAAYEETMAEKLQVIPARHGTATFVPKGSSIKIVNTSGTQVIDTWAFALPTPPSQSVVKEDLKQAKQDAEDAGEKTEDAVKEEPEKVEEKAPAPAKKASKKTKDKDMGLPSQEEAEQATAQLQKQQDDASSQKAAGWSSYLPSIVRGGQQTDEQKKEEASVTKQNSKTWGQYFGAGKSYLPTKDVLAAFAINRDPNKSYAEQLADFSKTPVGAAGMSMVSGSGYASAAYAGYSAYSSTKGGSSGPPPMEFLSMPHTRAATCHLVPRVDDVLVSNLREPMLTLVEDTSPGAHDTLIAACDPQRYAGLGVEKWEEHGSCAENLVLALKELNERAGLKGAKGIGADVTVHAVPAPLNLFMNIPWRDSGDLKFAAPAGKEGDYVRLRAERDVVIVMSACPQDVLEINAKDPKDGHFLVEEGSESSEDEDVRSRLERAEKDKGAAKPKPKGTPKKLNGVAKKPAAKPAAAKPAAAKPAAAKSATAKPAAAKPAAAPAAAKPAAPKSPVKKPSIPSVPSTDATEKKSSTPAASTTGAPVEKKKPKKLEKRGSVQAPSVKAESTKAAS